MANFIAISGPSVSGKTTLVQTLRALPQLSQANIENDLHETVWNDLVDKGFFYDFTEITKDGEYLCVYIMKVINYYNELIDRYKDMQGLVILDGSWVDLAIYANLNLWYSWTMKDLQEEILADIMKFDNKISRIYITRPDDITYPPKSHDIRSSITNFTRNRKLELRYYEVASHLSNSILLPSNDTMTSAEFILNDLSKLGYI